MPNDASLNAIYTFSLWPSCQLEIWQGDVFSSQGDVLIGGRRNGLKTNSGFWNNASVEEIGTIFDSRTEKILGIPHWPQIFCLYRRPQSENFFHYYPFRESLSHALNKSSDNGDLVGKTVALLPLSWRKPEISARLAVEVITSRLLHRLDVFPPTNLRFQLWSWEQNNSWHDAVEKVTWKIASCAYHPTRPLPIWQRVK